MSNGFSPSPATPGVITANDLRLGHCVWMRDGGWTADPRAAELFEDEAIAELALLDAIGQADLVVGPYLVEARRGADGRPEPAHFRERFRRTGPTNYPDHHHAAAEASHV